MNNVLPVHVETVAVENSDDRLAEVERAKRTGQPFRSVAANKTEIVPWVVANQIAEEKARQNTYKGRFGATYAAHLQPYHEAMEDPDFIPMTNHEKAEAHERHSAELVRKQMEDEVNVRKMMAEGYEPSLAVQQANLERAKEHEERSREYAEIRRERVKDVKPVLEMVDESVKILRAEELAGKPFEEQATALQAVANVPNAMEESAREAFIIKDQIVSTEIPFESEVSSHEELRAKDRPGIEIMEKAGSPEALREETALAQLYADNRTEEAVKAQQKMNEVAADMSLDENTVGEIVEAAEKSVGGDKKSDEMLENPSE
jgi:hypothetical protein